MNNVKKVLLVAMLVLLLLPVVSFAKTEKYASMNLEETFASEGIELANADYQENDKQIPIYLFRGNNCSVCRSFLEYLNSIIEEYGKYFKLVSYEVWSDQRNANLYSDVAEFFDKQPRGVPFIVIGDQVFEGYNEVYNSQIKEAILDLYNSKDRYDVFEEMENASKLEYRKQFFQFAIFSVISSIIITLIAATVVVKYVNHKNKILQMKLEELEKKIYLHDTFSDDKDKNKNEYHKKHKTRKVKENSMKKD